MKRFLPWIILPVAAALIFPNWVPPKTAANDFDFSGFGKIPVLGLFGWQQSDRKYFSFAEFAPFLKQIDEQGAQSEKL